MEKLKVSGLWRNRTADGQEWFSGQLSPGAKIMIFPNRFKSKPNEPDFELFLAPIERKSGEVGTSAPRIAPLAVEDDVK